MNLKYYKDGDVLVIKTSTEPYDHAEMAGNIVVHYTKTGKPVRIEILEASKFFAKEDKAIPQDVKKKFFSTI